MDDYWHRSKPRIGMSWSDCFHPPKRENKKEMKQKLELEIIRKESINYDQIVVDVYETNGDLWDLGVHLMTDQKSIRFKKISACSINAMRLNIVLAEIFGQPGCDEIDG